MNKRCQYLNDYLTKIDGHAPEKRLAKHLKMAIDPFLFFRGSSQLFYADLKDGVLNLPKQLSEAPFTSIMGDCHLSNFGFFTEEGSHGDNVIFAPNDFDDACIGPAVWDISRFLVSLVLAEQYGKTVTRGELTSFDEKYIGKPVVSESQTLDAMQAFIDVYVDTCRFSSTEKVFIGTAIEGFPTNHILHKSYQKAVNRAAGGSDFEFKSSLAKAVSFTDSALRFKRDNNKYLSIDKSLYEEIEHTFSPYVDDVILDIVIRAGAGTGSLNLERYYLLVGPKDYQGKTDLPLCHIVEIKQQRKAAPLYHFDKLSPINRLNPAHLTVQCQRRMQRNADLVLDEVMWKEKYWLVRSRHHAKVGIDPEKVVLGKKACFKNGFAQYAKACAKALALAHCRGDRRSKRFEFAMINALEDEKRELLSASLEYAKQVELDAECLKTLLG